MTRDFKFDEEVQRNFSEVTVKTLNVFPRMLGSLEGLLHNYHKDNPAGLVERSPLPLENLNASGRQIATMFLAKTIYYSRAIIENVNSGNLLVAFHSMRALIEVVAAVRHTLEKLEPMNSCMLQQRHRHCRASASVELSLRFAVTWRTFRLGALFRERRVGRSGKKRQAAAQRRAPEIRRAFPLSQDREMH